MNNTQRARMRAEYRKRDDTPFWLYHSYRMEADNLPITKIAMAITIREMYLELAEIRE